MIRTAENILSGPFTREQVIQLIEEGKLDLTDEICVAGNYWIFLHEEEEVTAQLGVELPHSFFEKEEEDTQTESDKTPAAHLVKAAHHTPTGSMATPLAAMGARTAARNSTMAPAPQNAGSTQMASTQAGAHNDEDDRIPELSVPHEEIEQQTSVLRNRAIREFRPRDNNATRVMSMESALKEDLETARQQEPQFSSSQSSDGGDAQTSAASGESYSFRDQEVTPPPIEVPQSSPSPSKSHHHNTSLSLDPEPADWTARFWGVVAFILIAAAAVVWFFAFRKPS